MHKAVVIGMLALMLVSDITLAQQAPTPATQPTTRRAQRGPDPRAKRYELGPDSLVQEGVPQGTLEGPILFKSSIIAGTVRKYWVWVPSQYDPATPACVFVFQDGQRATNPNGSIRVQNAMANLIHRKEMPVTIGIFITPGHRAEEYPDSLGMNNPNNRAQEYDAMGNLYARFICDEMLPEVGKKYNLTKDPEGRSIGGSSSGAIAAWTVAWERPNEFRKVISFIGSFTNIRGGHVYPELIRTTEKKPIRVFLQDGLYDNRRPDRPQSDWYLQNQLMKAALEEKGYDMQFVLGEGAHSDDHGGSLLPVMLQWMWRDYPGVTPPATINIPASVPPEAPPTPPVQ